MDTKPLWRVSYKTTATDTHGKVEVKTWTEVWQTYVRPNLAEVQGYWTYLCDIPSVKVTDLDCQPIHVSVFPNLFRRIVEV